MLDLLPNDEAGSLTASLPRVVACRSPNARRRRSARSKRGSSINERLDWDEFFALAAPCLAPHKLDASNMPALERWRNAEHLAAALPSVTVHESPTQTVQMMSMVQPYGRLAELQWRRPWLERNMSMASFLRKAAATTTEERSSDDATADDVPTRPYLFMPVDQLPKALRADLGALVDVLGSPFLPAIETNLWAGAPNVSSPLHYDAAHNVYLQLVGTKRVVLMPPEAAPRLYVHPRLHPSTRQSQLDLRAIRPDRFPRFLLHGGAGGGAGAPPRMVEALLQPGDRLYVPPYWWHRVSNVGRDAAIAVAVYSHSTPMRAYAVLKEHPLPSYLLRGCQSKCYEGACCLVALRAYVLALAALHPPELGVSSADDDRSFACVVTHRCACFADADAFELRGGLQADADADARVPPPPAPSDGRLERSWEPGVELVREILETRYTAHLDDREIVEGLSPMLEHARRRMRQKTAPPPPTLPTSAMRDLRWHARALRDRVRALPSRGDGVMSAAMWRTEIGSLIEDVTAATLGARETEAALRWVAGGL